MKTLKLLKLEIWIAKFYLVCEYPACSKSTQTHLLTKVRDFERSAASKLENAIFTHFFTSSLGENYSNSSFFTSSFAEKMKSICSNHIFEPTLSHYFFKLMSTIEKLIPCSLQGGPFGGPACPPVLYTFEWLQNFSYALNK